MAEESKFSPSNTNSMSNDIRDLALAFAKAKREFCATGKSGKNSHQNYTYAKIGDIYNGVDEALVNHEIIIWHFIEMESDTPLLRTRLIHAPTGQYVESLQRVVSEKPGSQSFGAALTYARRYALLCLCAIAAEDDDGAEEERYIVSKQAVARITAVQVDIIKSALSAKEKSIVLWKNILNSNKISQFEDLPAHKFDDIMDYIAKG